MFTNILLENNPYFKYDMNQMCIVCNKKLEQGSIHSVCDEVSQSMPVMVFPALQTISDFKDLNITDGPQSICQFCLNNTKAALRFHKMCNQSVSLLQSYMQHQEELKNKLEPALPEETDSNTLSELRTISPELITTSPEITALSESTALSDSTINFSEVLKTIPEIIKKKVRRNTSGAVKIQCKFCHKYYRRDYMTYHCRSHTGEKPYSCKSCDRRFVHPTELKLHTLVHSNQRDHLCSFCGNAFKRKSTLLKHSLTHSGERPYECRICNKKFTAPGILKEHYSVHSNEKPFTCEKCAKSFATRKFLRQHMISHAEVKRHECHLCGNRFTQAHSLRTHQLKHCKGHT